MKVFKLGFWALFTLGVLVVSVSLVVQNQEPITVSLFNFVSEPYQKWLVILISAAIGFVLASLFFIVELIVLETKNIRLRRANQNYLRALNAVKEQSTAALTTSTAAPGTNASTGSTNSALTTGSTASAFTSGHEPTLRDLEDEEV